MMTFEKLKQIINTEIPFNDLKKNEGIFEFYEMGNISIGISYEDDEDGNDCYIYNLFYDVDEYINICGKGNPEQPINDFIINELIENLLQLQ